MEQKPAECDFCNGPELAGLFITGRHLGIGTKCYNKAIDRGVTWALDTKLKVLRSQIRQRQRQPLSRPLEKEEE